MMSNPVKISERESPQESQKEEINQQRVKSDHEEEKQKSQKSNRIMEK
jgi:hypothetical protein